MNYSKFDEVFKVEVNSLNFNILEILQIYSKRNYFVIHVKSELYSSLSLKTENYEFWFCLHNIIIVILLQCLKKKTKRITVNFLPVINETGLWLNDKSVVSITFAILMFFSNIPVLYFSEGISMNVPKLNNSFNSQLVLHLFLLSVCNSGTSISPTYSVTN